MEKINYKPTKPKDASTLIIIRKNKKKTFVLEGGATGAASRGAESWTPPKHKNQRKSPEMLKIQRNIWFSLLLPCYSEEGSTVLCLHDKIAFDALWKNPDFYKKSKIKYF